MFRTNTNKCTTNVQLLCLFTDAHGIDVNLVDTLGKLSKMYPNKQTCVTMNNNNVTMNK